ncbi:MAG: sulfite exporter TauE/SafE family protein, partial [Cyanobacteria bacterium K_DeepCast_35m_m2_023]|nr:sulfite exporter TauE/SafE family protein [Cyanobacteria bacterium K_DeepCast_35m_m2_023]
GSLSKAGIISDAGQLAVFAAAAVVAAWLLLNRNSASPGTALPLTRVLQPARSPWPLAAQGLVVGLLTGIAGVGGGFAIVPALVLIAGLPMALASGTSLVLIALNGVVALVATGVWPAAQLPLMLPLLGGGLLGALFGQRLAPRLKEQHLRRGFAALLLGSALFTALEAVDTHRRASTSTPHHRAFTSPRDHHGHEQRRNPVRGGDHHARL